MSAAPRRRRARGHPIRCDCSLFSCALRPPAVRAPQPAARSGRPERTYGSHRSLEEREATALGLYCVRGGRFCGADRPQVSRGCECVEPSDRSEFLPLTSARLRGHSCPAGGAGKTVPEAVIGGTGARRFPPAAEERAPHGGMRCSGAMCRRLRFSAPAVTVSLGNETSIWT
jgi:hypothetical protein